MLPPGAMGEVALEVTRGELALPFVDRHQHNIYPFFPGELAPTFNSPGRIAHASGRTRQWKHSPQEGDHEGSLN